MLFYGFLTRPSSKTWVNRESLVEGVEELAEFWRGGTKTIAIAFVNLSGVVLEGISCEKLNARFHC